MKNQDQVILREIQKNTHMGMEAIDALMPRVTQKEFANELAKQAMKYGDYYESATSILEKEKSRLYKDVVGTNRMLRSGIWLRTLGNCSTSHMAEMVIQGANRGITDMYKVLNRNTHATKEIQNLAKELMDMEEKTIGRLKDFL